MCLYIHIYVCGIGYSVARREAKAWTKINDIISCRTRPARLYAREFRAGKRTRERRSLPEETKSPESHDTKEKDRTNGIRGKEK